MATVDVPAPPKAEPITRRWTKQEFYQMGDLGWFEGQRAELIDGEIVVLSPQNFRHAYTTDRIAALLRSLVGPQYWVRTQLPLDTGRTSLPEPDVSIVLGPPERYQDHPSETLLAIEVSDTTLAFDRGRKAANYAAAGIADCWIVNLNQRQLEVFRDPQPDPTQANRWRYRSSQILTPADTVSPLQLPAVRLPVDSLL